MAFEKGKSGNPHGRPTKEAQAIKNLNKTEVDLVLRKLKRAAPEAVAMIIAAMSSTQMTEKDRLVYAQKVVDLFAKIVTIDNQLKKGNTTEQPDEDEQHKAPVIQFSIAG